MIFIESFKNYEEFKQIFGINKHGNGVKSRKNKILLALLKDRNFFHWWLQTRAACKKKSKSAHKAIIFPVDYLHATNMEDLKNFVKFLLGSLTPSYYAISDEFEDSGYKFDFGSGFDYILYSKTFKMDGMQGLSLKGGAKSIRYINTERNNRTFWMKAGTFITKCIEEHSCTSILPEQVKRWIGEEFAREWESHVTRLLSGTQYELHVNQNFKDIYDSSICKGDFNSCMEDKDFYHFYENAVDASAAYLTDEHGYIVARCIIYNDVYDEKDNHYRLAERQYSTGCSDVLKQILVDKLIAGGYIDGYKCVGASCSDSHNFVTNKGKSMEHLNLCIDCHLERNDALSYQDSFKYYNFDYDCASNDDCSDYQVGLDSTCGQYHLEEDCYSDYNEEWIPEEEAVYDKLADSYIYKSQACDCIENGERFTTNDELLSRNYYSWSDYEDAFISDDECVFVDSENDYFLKKDCVEDIDGDWQLESYCTYSEYHEGYVLTENARFSQAANSYIDEYKALYSEYEKDWIPDGDAIHSEITDDFYSSEESKLEDEEKFRKEHALILAPAV